MVREIESARICYTCAWWDYTDRCMNPELTTFVKESSFYLTDGRYMGTPICWATESKVVRIKERLRIEGKGW